MRTADELIDSIVNSSEIPGGRRREIERELRSHIEDFVNAARESGQDQDEIDKLVFAHFGDPGQVAKGFAWVYRNERRRMRALVYALATVLLATCLTLSILSVQAGLALGFGTPIVNVLASRHTLIETLDILASVAVYLGLASLEQNHGFQKAIGLLLAILIPLTAALGAAGLPISFLIYGLINGVFFRSVRRFVAAGIARTAIVMVCFPLAGVALALQRSPLSNSALLATCASWIVMGAGYQLMTHMAKRVDAALLKGFERT